MESETKPGWADWKGKHRGVEDMPKDGEQVKKVRRFVLKQAVHAERVRKGGLASKKGHDKRRSEAAIDSALGPVDEE